GAALGYGLAQYVGRQGGSRDRIIDKIDRANALAFAKLLEFGEARQMAKTMALAANGFGPVELLFRIYGEDEALIESRPKSGTGYTLGRFGYGPHHAARPIRNLMLCLPLSVSDPCYPFRRVPSPLARSIVA